MKIYIWDLMFGNCKKGIHKFEQFLIKESMPELNGKYLTTDILYAVKTRIYEIRCKHCGIKGE